MLWWSDLIDNPNLKSVNKILWCYESNESSSAVLSHGTIYLVCSSNFLVCGWNPLVLPFKWNPFSSTFTWYSLFSTYSSNFWVCGWNPMVFYTIQIKPLQQYFHMELFIPSYFTKENLIIYVNFFLWNLQWTLTELRTNSASQARARFKNIIITNNYSQNFVLSQQSIKVGLINLWYSFHLTK